MNKKVTYTKDNIAEAVKLALDAVDGKVLYPETNTYRQISMQTAKAVVDVIFNHLQHALIRGERIYIPEIGTLNQSKVNPGRRSYNPVTKEYTVTSTPRWKVKLRTSLQMADKLAEKHL